MTRLKIQEEKNVIYPLFYVAVEEASCSLIVEVTVAVIVFQQTLSFHKFLSFKICRLAVVFSN